MKKAFVTYFDSNYLARGLIMYESLYKNCDKFTLYIIAFDDDCYCKLLRYNLENAVIISYKEFEDEELLAVKHTRTRTEYLWTTTPKAILYVFKNYKEQLCTYLDADIMFFGNPDELIGEMKEDDIAMITEHRYADYCDLTNISGIYNVQFMPFKNGKANVILEWWKARCLENCSFDGDNGYCGDQKYLDDWPQKFTGVHVMENIGGGVAPWNVARYTFRRDGKCTFVKDNNGDREDRLIFYHFHNITFFDKGIIRLADQVYFIPDTAMAYIYKEYLKLYGRVIEKYDIKEGRWSNMQHFRDDDKDHLIHSSNYYLLDMFL